MAKLFRNKAKGISQETKATSSLSPEEQSFLESRQVIQQKAINPLIPILLGALIFLFTFVAIFAFAPNDTTENNETIRYQPIVQKISK